MRSKKFIKIIFFSMLLVIGINCQKSSKSVNFANVCQQENLNDVQIKGFLYQSKATPNLTSNSFLLVENENGTGGFIKILSDKENILSKNGKVEIIGKILKEENTCVLEVEKIETP